MHQCPASATTMLWAKHRRISARARPTSRAAKPARPTERLGSHPTIVDPKTESRKIGSHRRGSRDGGPDDLYHFVPVIQGELGRGSLSPKSQPGVVIHFGAAIVDRFSSPRNPGRIAQGTT